jgi:hypothetical protein
MAETHAQKVVRERRESREREQQAQDSKDAAPRQDVTDATDRGGEDAEPETKSDDGPYRLVLGTGEIVAAENVVSTEHYSKKAGANVPVVSSYRVED